MPVGAGLGAVGAALIVGAALAVGASVGALEVGAALAVGANVGTNVGGGKEGLQVGIMDGKAVVGFGVGAWSGKVGEGVVGLAVGRVVGTNVGVYDGAAEGPKAKQTGAPSVTAFVRLPLLP